MVGLLTKKNVELQTAELEARKNYEEIKLRMSQVRKITLLTIINGTLIDPRTKI